MNNSKIPMPGKRVVTKHVRNVVQKYICFSEGEELEMRYLKGISTYKKKLDINSLIELIPLDSSKINPLSLYKDVIANPSEYINYNDISKDDVIVFFVDRDRHSFVDEQYEELMKHNGETIHLAFGEKTVKVKTYIALANPSFELWLIYHYLQKDFTENELEDLLENKKLSNSSTYIKKRISNDLALNVSNFRFKNFIERCNKYSSGVMSFSNADIILRRAVHTSKKYDCTLTKLEDKVGTNVGCILETILK